MAIDRSFQVSQIALLLFLSSLTACANSPFGKSLEKSLSADPQLQQPTTQPDASPTLAPETPTATEPELPTDFPTAIPRYPTATLKKVTPMEDATSTYPIVTQWTSPDPSNAIEAFYQRQFAQDDWQLSSSTPTGQKTTMVAKRQNLEVEVVIDPSTDASETALTIAYREESTAASPTPDTSNPPSPKQFSDLQTTAASLRPYITDLAQLGVLTPSTPQSNTFAPDQPLKRREYARWLLAAHNLIYADTPSKQIRPATASNTPSFGDVPTTDPDFDDIQGLAEAGIIPSSLSGEATAVKFRPDDPMTREDTIAWKVPLDWRQALPTATIASIAETWGFQDTAQIDPKVLSALLADFQSGERANIRRSFGYTRLFQPKKSVTRAEAAASLWYFGNANTGRSAKEALEPTSSKP